MRKIVRRAQPGPIGPDESVREILARYPTANRVFERHGLLGCGGPNGPREPVAFFARVHRVNPTTLLDELNAHVSDRARDVAEPAASSESATTYVLFLGTSLTVALVAGFTTGIAALVS